MKWVLIIWGISVTSPGVIGNQELRHEIPGPVCIQGYGTAEKCQEAAMQAQSYGHNKTYYNCVPYVYSDSVQCSSMR